MEPLEKVLAILQSIEEVMDNIKHVFLVHLNNLEELLKKLNALLARLNFLLFELHILWPDLPRLFSFDMWWPNFHLQLILRGIDLKIIESMKALFADLLENVTSFVNDQIASIMNTINEILETMKNILTIQMPRFHIDFGRLRLPNMDNIFGDWRGQLKIFFGVLFSF